MSKRIGRCPHDPAGPTYGVAAAAAKKTKGGDARKTTLDQLDLKLHRAFGYWFDFGDDWYFTIRKSRKKPFDTTPGVEYPRVIEKVGADPEQYPDWE